MYMLPGARDLLLQAERQRFLTTQWPRVVTTIRRLGLRPEELLKTLKEAQ